MGYRSIFVFAVIVTMFLIPGYDRSIPWTRTDACLASINIMSLAIAYFLTEILVHLKGSK